MTFPEENGLAAKMTLHPGEKRKPRLKKEGEARVLLWEEELNNLLLLQRGPPLWGKGEP